MFLTLGLRFRGLGKYMGVGIISEKIYIPLPSR
jgi:hypothetical protein